MIILSAATRAEGPLKHIEQTEDGNYILEPQDINAIAEYIRKLERENDSLRARAETLEQLLIEEREAFKKTLEQANKVIELQEQQIRDYKELNKLRSEFENKFTEMLEEERTSFNNIIEQMNETVRLQKQQIQDYKSLYEEARKPDIITILKWVALGFAINELIE